MGSIVHIQVGQCGNQLGTKFWEEVSREHGIGPSGLYCGDSDLQLEKIDACFKESTSGRYVPRAVLVDLEPSTLDSVRGGVYGGLFQPDNFISGPNSAGNNWATGYYTGGGRILDSILDVIRLEAERCDVLHAFQFVHSLGGGTGSGLGMLLLQNLSTEYPARIRSMYSVFPSPGMSDTLVETYNCVLSMHKMIEFADAVFCLDNEALFRPCGPAATFGDLNRLVSNFMTGTTCSLRFPGPLNADLRKLLVNLVPFPRLHFFSCGAAPLVHRGSRPGAAETVPELVWQLFDSKNMMSVADPRRGRYLAASAHFRGMMSTQEIEEQIMMRQRRHASSFIPWIPESVSTSLCAVPPRGLRMAATLVANTTALRHSLHEIDRKFGRMYARRSFVHWYVSEGLETAEFDEARSNMRDLIQECDMYETAGISWYSDSEEESSDEDGQEGRHVRVVRGRWP
jgi:tubulin beta